MRRIVVHQTFGGNKVPVGTEGYFHGWGLESSEWRGHIAEWEVPPTGMASDTVAIIELDDGRVFYAFPEQIRFVEPYALTAKLAATPAGIARACGMENEVEDAQEVSATNPPKGWKIKPDDAPRKFGCLFWHPSDREWRYCDHRGWGEPLNAIIANPIEVTP